MAVFMRWCICPVITEWQQPPLDWTVDGLGLELLPDKPGGWWLRRPKVAIIRDPGRPSPKVVTHSSVISNGPAGVRGLLNAPPLVEADDDKWCLSLCAAVDFTELEADPDIEDVLDEIYPYAEHPVFLNNTPRMRNWNAGRIDKVKRVMGERGKVPGDVIEARMTEHTPFKEALFEIGRRLNPTFDAAKTHTMIKEA